MLSQKPAFWCSAITAFIVTTSAASAVTGQGLYQAWLANNRENHTVAAEAAQAYLRQNPNGNHAGEVRAWLNAYHTALESLGLLQRQERLPANSGGPRRVARKLKTSKPLNADRTNVTSSQPNDGSLPHAMKFIEEELTRNRVVDYSASLSGGSAEHVRIEFSNISADPITCRIHFHFKSQQDAIMNQDADAVLYLAAVSSIHVESAAQETTFANLEAGHPESVTETDPPVTVVEVYFSEGAPQNFYFYDDASAQMFARAETQAAQLCGADGL